MDNKKISSKIPNFSPLPGGGGRDFLCFDFTADGVKAARVKNVAGKKVVSDVFYKDTRGFSGAEVVKTLKDFIDRSFRSKDFIAYASIPSNLLITKNIEIPSQDPKEIRDIINLQAGRLTPYSREEVIIDYINIGVFRQSYTKLLLVIVNKDVINKQLAIFSESGIRIRKIFLPSQTLGDLAYRYLKYELKDSPYCLIHADAMTTDFGVFVRERQIFLRSIPIGAHHLLTEKDKYVNRFIEELKRSFDAYQAEDIEGSPLMAVFTGAIGGIKDLEVLMMDAFRITVRLLNQADLIPRGDHLSKEALDSKEVSMLNVVSPLLKIEAPLINLIPDEIKVKLALEERGRDVIKTGILVMTILLFLCGYFLVSIYLKSEYLKRLNVRYKALNEEASTIEKDFSKTRIISNYLASRGVSLNVLAELYDLTPLEISLTSLRLRDNGSVSVRGEAVSMSSVFSYVKDLENSTYFAEVKTKYTSKKKVETQELVDFEIGAILEKADKGKAKK